MENLICSFCERKKDTVEYLVRGGEVAICETCVEVCIVDLQEQHESAMINSGVEKEHDFTEEELLEIIDDEKYPEEINEVTIPLKTPKEIFNELNKFVSGQNDAKKELALSAYSHLQKIFNPDKFIKKSNVLLLGPSGSGKTLLCETLSSVLNLPFISIDATTYTETGYLGNDIDDIVEDLMRAADDNKDLAERGIVFVDEIDKISSSINHTGNKDISGASVQKGFLKIMEGKIVNLRDSNQNVVVKSFDTSNLLFIFGGAFEGLNKIVGKRFNKKSIGITADISVNKDWSIAKNMKTKDLITFGIIREFIGRMTSVAHLSPLSKEDLIDILLNTENSVITEFYNRFEIEGVDLSFKESAIEEIAEQAIKLKLGARGLRRIVEDKLKNLIFDIAGNNAFDMDILITPEFISGKSKEPIYLPRPTNSKKLSY